jgi:hypothetical protein
LTDERDLGQQDCIKIARKVFLQFKKQQVRILQKKDGKPRKYEEIVCSEEIISSIADFRKQLVCCLQNIVIQRAGRQDVLPGHENLIMFIDEGSEKVHFTFNDKRKSLTRHQFMDYLAELNERENFQYIAQYIAQHIEWEILWSLLPDEAKEMINNLPFSRFKEIHPAFITKDFPAKTLNNYLEKKQQRH